MSFTPSARFCRYPRPLCVGRCTRLNGQNGSDQMEIMMPYRSWRRLYNFRSTHITVKRLITLTQSTKTGTTVSHVPIETMEQDTTNCTNPHNGGSGPEAAKYP